MAPYQLILATDLDGTFLEGTHQDKRFFYKELMRLRDQVLLIYATGRPAGVVETFCRQGYLPFPHFVVSDHGSHIVDGAHFDPIEELQTPIIQKWNNSNSRIKELLKDDIGIRLQPIDPPYRLAYYYDPAQLHSQTLQKIADAGFDCILSCDSYLDILPKGVNKGSSLLNLLTHLNLSQETTITCGDSLNDLPLFQTGLKSIAVANSEPKLVAEIQKLKNVYLSPYPGVAGIMEGLRYFKKYHLFENLGEIRV